MVQAVRVGVVGCGHWGKNHLHNFNSLPGADLVAICDLDAGLLEAMSAQYPGTACYADVHKLIDDGICDALIVTTVASTHYAIVKVALEASLHVLAEKPLTLSVEESDELVRLAEDRERILFVGHTFLYNPSVRYIKELIDKGVLGDVYYIKTRRTHLGLIREDVNVVWDLAPHDISMLLYLLGEGPTKIQAMGGNFLRDGREDVALINIAFPSGAIASVTVSWADSNKERYVDIVGSKARIVFNDLDNLEPVRIYHKGVSAERDARNFGEFQYMLRDGDINSPKIEQREPLNLMCQAFLDAVVTGEPPLSDGACGREVVNVLCRIDEALRDDQPVPRDSNLVARLHV